MIDCGSLAVFRCQPKSISVQSPGRVWLWCLCNGLVTMVFGLMRARGRPCTPPPELRFQPLSARLGRTTLLTACSHVGCVSPAPSLSSLLLGASLSPIFQAYYIETRGPLLPCIFVMAFREQPLKSSTGGGVVSPQLGRLLADSLGERGECAWKE